jgi:hypothetical protein
LLDIGSNAKIHYEKAAADEGALISTYLNNNIQSKSSLLLYHLVVYILYQTINVIKEILPNNTEA